MKSKTRNKASRGGATYQKASELKRKKRSTSSRPMSARQTQEPGVKVQPETRGLKGRTPNNFPVVGVGASAGGLEAFTELLKNLPLDTGMGFVLVQHLDPQHESALADLLTRATSMPVREVTNNLRVDANHVYVIPPNTNLGIAQGVLKLQAREQSSTPTRSIDSFFESLAEDQRERAIGVILSGTATDGTVGMEAIKAEGGITFAQDSARYDSMPRSAIAAGCVDFVLKPADIAKELARIAKHPYVAGQRHESMSPEDDRASETAHENDDTPLPAGGHGTPRTGAKASRAKAEGGDAKAGENDFKKILLLLRNHSGVDFSLYKSTTIQRRISRRMVLNKQDTLEGYTTFLRGHAKELDALYSDVLISVTSFFRNPDAFDVLKRKVFPKILQQRGDETVRVWVLGCSTGQEAYSIAMALMEAAENAPRARKLQVFATDLNDVLLDKARHGLYAKSLAQDVSPERLRRFFVEEEAGYRIVKPLREMVVFARQNVIRDSPFSRMDLISCRNLLIYLEPSLQKKAIPTFHYALKPQGFLFLGASESIGTFTDLFELVDKKHKIYSKKAVPTQALHLPVKKDHSEQPSPGPRASLPIGKGQAEPPESLRGEVNAQREADRVTVNQFAPPGVLINAQLQILQFRGPTGSYLQPPTGKASFDVLKMAREGLMLPLRAAINKAKKGNKTARKANVRVNQNGKTRTVNLEVIPLKNLRERCFLILFEDAEKVGLPAQERVEPRGGPRSGRPISKKEESHRIKSLETELSDTRDYLQSIQEQHEAANEELQASNEEVQSANEELQSINEELETSKEELESANEELTTVNEEMSHRNTELSRLNADLGNLHASVNMAILVLARDLTIRRFTTPAEKIFNLLATDVGRPLSGVRHNLIVVNEHGSRGNDPRSSATTENQSFISLAATTPFPLEDLLRDVIDTVRVHEREVRDKDGRWYVLRARPYMTTDNKIDGAVLVLVDIDDLKRSEREAKSARDYAEATIRTARDPLIVLRADLRVNTANEAFYKTFKTTPDQTEGRLIYDLGDQQWNIPKLRILLEEILPRNSFFDDFEVTHDFPQIGRRTMLLNARRQELDDGAAQMILLAIEDVTERQRAHAATVSLAAIVNSSDDAIIGIDLDGVITSWNKGAERLFGYTAQEAIGQPITMLIPPDRQHEQPEILGRLKRGESLDHFETVRWRKNRSPLEISLTISPIKDATGQVIGASKIARDITKRKEAEEALGRAMEFDEAVMSNMGEGLYTVDKQGLVTKMNPTAEKLLGWTLEELRGKKMHDVIHYKHPDGSPFAAEECAGLQVLREGKALKDFEDTFIRKDGQFLPVSYSSSPLRDRDGEIVGLVVVFQDITERQQAQEALRHNQAELENRVAERTTELEQANAALGRDIEERKKLEEQLLQSQKMESIGVLAGGIAHDFNNILNIIQGYAFVLRGHGIQDKETSESLTVIDETVHRGSALVQQLLTLARKSTIKVESVNVNGLIERLITLITQTFPKTIELNPVLEPDLPPIMADKNQIEQALLNLCVNARDAMSDGGRLSFKTQSIEGATLQGFGKTLDGRYVCIEVSDTGVGMDESTRKRVFEPFFTTKNMGQGTGLGLSVVYGIVKNHNGFINVESKPESGTSFKLYFPVAQSLEKPATDEIAKARFETTERPDGHGTILLVEDEKSMLDLLEKTLVRHGYRVLAAADGKTALNIYRRSKKAIDVVLLDIGLPKLAGRDVLLKIKNENPDVKVVIASGYLEPKLKSEIDRAGVKYFLSKPYRPDEVVKALQSLIEGES
jgi:two-component system, chemotaxis family, CheB/CheR fusion protein